MNLYENTECFVYAFLARHQEMLGYKVAKTAVVTKGKRVEAPAWPDSRSEETKEEVSPFEEEPSFYTSFDLRPRACSLGPAQSESSISFSAITDSSSASFCCTFCGLH